ncbi:hypothetical protein KY342_03180 [Candidatus Woesearchaeota archaeon]|nr:hypothetical protein [Candidatus Woesearchaeota archaeon]
MLMRKEVTGKVHYVKEESGLLWFHFYSWYGRGWMSISKNVFERSMKKKLMKELYGKENRRIKREIAWLQREAKRLRREGKDMDARSNEYQIHALRLKIKKDVHPHDLVGYKVSLTID